MISCEVFLNMSIIVCFSIASALLLSHRVHGLASRTPLFSS